MCPWQTPRGLSPVLKRGQPLDDLPERLRLKGVVEHEGVIGLPVPKQAEVLGMGILLGQVKLSCCYGLQERRCSFADVQCNR